MFFLVTDSYDKFTEFLLRYPFLQGRVAYNPKISVLLTEPSVLILIEGSRATDCYHNIISLNRRNPRIAFIDYDDKPTWEPEASIIVNDIQYTKMYKIGVSNKATSSLNKKPLSNKIPNKSHSITPKAHSKNKTEKVSKN